MFSRETPFSAAQLSCFGTGVLNSKHLNNDHKSTIFHLFCVGLMASNFGYFSAYFTRTQKIFSIGVEEDFPLFSNPAIENPSSLSLEMFRDPR
ncbi:uncharacterized protein [Henckelia pumila]|uniref:uncharacterized protein isoform X5 n=1 Tax=Henckelia pumila TaxID=405737 RepID=UPI003C6E8B38